MHQQFHPQVFPQINDNIYIHIHTTFYVNVYDSVVHSNPKVENTKCPSTELNNWSIAKQNMIYPQNGTSFGNKKWSIDTCPNIDVPWKQHLSERSQTQKTTYCMTHSFIWNFQAGRVSRESRLVFTKGCHFLPSLLPFYSITDCQLSGLQCGLWCQNVKSWPLPFPY